MRQLCIGLPYNLRVLQKRALCLIYLAKPRDHTIPYYYFDDYDDDDDDDYYYYLL